MKDKSDVSGGTMIERDIDDAPYTMIPNALLADTGISWKAKGVISYLLGKPSHWKARTKDIENHGTGGVSEVRAALQELRTAGYARLERHTEKGKVLQFVLRVANRRKYTNDNGNRVDVSRDAEVPQVDKPQVEKPDVENPHVVFPDVENRYHRKKEGRKKDLRNNEKEEKITSSNKAAFRASGDGAAAAADLTPTAQGSRSSAEHMIKEFRTWGKAARIPATIVPAERTALQEFFTDNPGMTPHHLCALMLAAWMMEGKKITAGTETHESYWYCRVKSRRIKTFLQFLPDIQDELQWENNAEQINKVYRVAKTKFFSQKAA